MTTPILSEMFIYPVKSLTGIKVSSWQVNHKGLLHDRKWMLIDSDSQFLSQRRLPKMALIKTQLTDTHLILSTDTTGSIQLPLYPDSGSAIETTLWNQQYFAKTTTTEADQWLSAFLGQQCRLVYQPDDSIRRVDPKFASSTDQVGFSDGYPFLIISDTSMLSLNQAMNLDLPIARFRPNLVISQCDAYAEDSWREICINDISFRLPKPCSRCSVPAIDPLTAETGKEPLTTLSRLRKWNKKVYFGQNALHDSVGQLSIGDRVNIIKRGDKQPPLSL